MPMTVSIPGTEGHFCWLDLAARDAGRAASFYTRLFGWQAAERAMGPGMVTWLTREGADVGSIYQLGPQQAAAGVPSHWTPYVAVNDLARARARAERLGARVLVREFRAPGLARVALVMDPGGALLGLWETSR